MLTTWLVTDPLLIAKSSESTLRRKLNWFHNHLKFSVINISWFELHIQLIHLLSDDTGNIGQAKFHLMHKMQQVHNAAFALDEDGKIQQNPFCISCDCPKSQESTSLLSVL